MNRRVFFLGLLAAMPGLLSAQETKLVNCRTLEAAGNFIGSDEVLVGDKVCRKLKPGETEPAKAETPKPLPGEVISGSESMSVADAAKANAKKTTPAKDSNASEPSTAPVHAVAPAENAAPASGQFPAEPAPVQPTPAPPPKKPEIALPVKPPPQQSVATSSPAPETPCCTSGSSVGRSSGVDHRCATCFCIGDCRAAERSCTCCSRASRRAGCTGDAVRAAGKGHRILGRKRCGDATDECGTGGSCSGCWIGACG